MKVLAGIDAGGSKTAGVVGDEHGTVLGSLVTGPSNILKDGALAVKKALSKNPGRGLFQRFALQVRH